MNFSRSDWSWLPERFGERWLERYSVVAQSSATLAYTIGSVHRDLVVDAPEKADDRYRFTYTIRRPPNGVGDGIRRLGRTLVRRTSPFVDRRHFGFDSRNFLVPHAEFWDTVYPLLHLCRQGGPLFDQGCQSARIVLRYDMDESVAQFFVRRAESVGIQLKVDAEGTSTAAPRRPQAEVALAFGGGKDSRLLYGILNELGDAPRAFHSSRTDVESDIQNLHVSAPAGIGLANRVMPALMATGSSFYFGSGIGEAHLHEPWHRHYDFGSPRALSELASLMSSYGPPVQCLAPLSALPYNLIQRILAERYPVLYAHQDSAEQDKHSEKNLHVVLCKLYRGLDVEHDMDPGAFDRLLKAFVDQQLAEPSDFGFRDYRLPIRREMRSIIHRMRSDERFAEVASVVPDSWRGDWIDYVHPYVVPNLDPRFARIFQEYADPVPKGEFRITT